MELQDEYPPVGETSIDDPQKFILELVVLGINLVHQRQLRSNCDI